MKRLLFDQQRAALNAFLRGFYEVVPQHLIQVFDYQELELMLNGLPEIDMADWKTNTEYKGKYEKAHKVIGWFWQTVEDFTEVERAKLLQFITGTSRVPASGFGALQSYDGNLRLFCITSTERSAGLFPKAHTCFNRIDLPLYDSQAELEQYLGIVVHMDVTGFSME
jgi:hypothetical protein